MRAERLNEDTLRASASASPLGEGTEFGVAEGPTQQSVNRPKTLSVAGKNKVPSSSRRLGDGPNWFASGNSCGLDRNVDVAESIMSCWALSSLEQRSVGESRWSTSDEQSCRHSSPRPSAMSPLPSFAPPIVRAILSVGAILTATS